MKKKKKHFANYIVALSIVAVVGYTAAAFVLQFWGNMEISATLTGCWYGFWTTEIVALAAIKNGKVKNNYKTGENQNES